MTHYGRSNTRVMDIRLDSRIRTAHVGDWRMVPAALPVWEHRRHARRVEFSATWFWLAGGVGAFLGMAIRMVAQ